MPTGSFTWTGAAGPSGAPDTGTSVRVAAVDRNVPRPDATGTHTPLRHSAANRSPRTWARCQGCTGRTTWSGPSTPAPARAVASRARSSASSSAAAGAHPAPARLRRQERGAVGHGQVEPVEDLVEVHRRRLGQPFGQQVEELPGAEGDRPVAVGAEQQDGRPAQPEGLHGGGGPGPEDD